MSDIQILKQEIDDTYTNVEVMGKRNEVQVIWNRKLGSIWVLNNNASHKAYHGTGRTFWSWSEALNAYKSGEMKGILSYVAEL